MSLKPVNERPLSGVFPPRPADPFQADLTRGLHAAFLEYGRMLNGELVSRPNFLKTVTTTYSMDPRDVIVLVDATGGSFQIDLPPANDSERRSYKIKKITAANTVTVATPGAELIDGAATVALTTQWSSLIVSSDRTDWFIL